MLLQLCLKTLFEDSKPIFILFTLEDVKYIQMTLIFIFILGLGGEVKEVKLKC